MTRKDLGGLLVEERSTIEDQVEKKILERESRKAFKERCHSLRHDRLRHGIRFYDRNGKGRLINGRKVYD